MLHGTPALQHNEVGVALSVGWPLTAGGQQFDYPQSPNTAASRSAASPLVSPARVASPATQARANAVLTLETEREFAYWMAGSTILRG
jgi:hypothetical protein